MKMANEYDDVCTVLEVIMGLLYLQKFSTVLVESAKFSKSCIYCKIVAWKEVVQHNKTQNASIHVSFRIKSNTAISLH